MRTFFAAAAYLTALLVAGCSGSAIVGDSPARPAAGAATAVNVTIHNFAFHPAALTVKAGTTVRFVNLDHFTHTATAENGSFNSGFLYHGSTWKYVFSKAGSYAYYCKIHSYMKGKIVVTAH